ncbi:hypothetical protein BU26DRAFT_561046 [Trematosphaeria pertusa]|uniref:Uncharacterized protein n=1 Tax=Trematosphaeria pertusa TaxID=390896 RepID=A0A6A6IV49_9PLEO|nr:uncharacterized protein BU26DRAFT_561046 [Trematosphaeria pertusa]KAF2253772.1 hypothetical protein BU26DRAFT_561046 [Trematosphaeria pertusa]
MSGNVEMILEKLDRAKNEFAQHPNGRGITFSRDAIQIADELLDSSLLSWEDVLEVRNQVSDMFFGAGLLALSEELDEEIEGALGQLSDKDEKEGLEQCIRERSSKRIDADSNASVGETVTAVPQQAPTLLHYLPGRTLRGAGDYFESFTDTSYPYTSPTASSEDAEPDGYLLCRLDTMIVHDPDPPYGIPNVVESLPTFEDPERTDREPETIEMEVDDIDED